jgi:pyridoxine 5-phosphate synthase
MAHLSVNINKIATLRNTRDLNIPDLRRLSRIALEAGADGITIHPRPDERHVRADDINPISELVREFDGTEFNMEGNPFHGKFIEQVRRVAPHQVTLVPDSVGQRTSDHGWKIKENFDRLHRVIHQFHEVGCRVSLFMDHDTTEMELAKKVGADRVELYTEPFAREFAMGDRTIVDSYATAARHAQLCGLGVNAGHDLNLFNLPFFVREVPNVLEVSIGHALIADAIEFGLAETVKKYAQAATRS